MTTHQNLQPKVFQRPSYGEQIAVDGHIYTIGNPIGNGGFGAVYECSDEWANRLVAKILLPQNKPYEEIKDNWLDELTKLVNLRHPNITYVHNAFEYNDTFYLILERCDITFEQLISNQEITGELWIPYVARDVLQGLHYIHTNNYVHKDMHPGNIFVATSYDRMVPNKEPVWSFKIGDLGISRLADNIRNADNTLLAQWMLPPEAIDSDEFGELGKCSDIYHTGLILLALLHNGQLEFSKDEIVSGVPRLMAEQHQSKFAPAIARALRRHVDCRTQSALEFWRDIQQFTDLIAT